jgi:hypothetical protein
MRLELLCWVGAGTITAVLLVALARTPRLGLALAVLVSVACIAVILRAQLAKIGVACIIAFSFTASWDNVAVAGMHPRVPLLVLGLIVLGLAQATKGGAALPWWIHGFGLTAIAITLLQVLFPISPQYLDARYATSEAGVALGSRPDALPSLMYLLLNVYAVPLAILLAVMAVPRALSRIIAAYVGGVALSSLAAYFGFMGSPFLADLLVTPVPAGFRAIGYTSHPLHLATSCVMALGLAVWMATRSTRVMRWYGSFATVAILLGLYASGSRGGNASAIIMLALCALLIPTVRRRGHLVAASVGGILAFVTIFMPSVGTSILRTTRLFGGVTNAQSDSGRSQLLDQAMADFAHSPIYGIGTRFIAEAHVLYPGLLAGGGVALFAAYVFFNVGSFRAALQVIPLDRALGGALLATMLASLAYWSVADEFTVASVQVFYGVLIAVAIQGSKTGDIPAAIAHPTQSAAPDVRSRSTISARSSEAVPRPGLRRLLG